VERAETRGRGTESIDAREEEPGGFFLLLTPRGVKKTKQSGFDLNKNHVMLIVFFSITIFYL
jgi:hypothetical protein